MTALVRRELGAVALLVFAVAGLAVSAYLTGTHYAAVAPVCSTSGIVDCAAVTQSRWSEVPGTAIPVTVPGMLFFLVSAGLALASLRNAARDRADAARLRLTHVAWAGAGMAAVFYLVYAELVELRRICEWCTVVHVLVFATLLVSLARLQRAPSGERLLTSAD
jgi:uncharacterized membrane protein